jgi:DnaK suppressor protein
MPVTELNQQQIEELRSMLISSQQALEEQMLSTGSSTKPVTLDQQSVGRVSRIDAIQQQQMAIANQQQADQLLQAQPYASLCIDCQSASENP